jgi:hypothetical protein
MRDLLIKFSPEKIFTEFAQQYIIENGKDKFEQLSNIVRYSTSIRYYLERLLLESKRPRFDELQKIINSHNYFLWSKEETVCMAGLEIIIRWSDEKVQNLDSEEEEIIKVLMINMIDECSRLKYNKFENFFKRYYRRMILFV